MMRIGDEIWRLRVVVGRPKRLDAAVAEWMDRWSAPALRVAIAIVFIWFETLKVLGISSARKLVAVTAYLVPGELFVPSSASGRYSLDSACIIDH